MNQQIQAKGFVLFRLMLLGSLLLLAVQQLCYDTRLPKLTIHMGYYVLTAGLVLAVGWIFYAYQQKQISERDILRLAGELYLLFVVAGASRYWLTDDRPRMESLIKVMIFRQIPKYSELYVSLLIFIGFIWLFQKPFKWLTQKRIAAMICSIMCIGITMLPHEQIGYKIMGSLLGTEEFYSLTTLAFLGYFFLGFWLAGEDGKKRRLWLGCAGFGMLLTIGLTWLYRYKLVKAMHFPFRWWEILIPVGFVLVLGLMYKRLTEEGLNDFLKLPHFGGRAAFSIFLLTYIKEFTHTPKMSTFEAVIIALVVWVLTALADAALTRLIHWLTNAQGFLENLLLYTGGFAVLMPAAYAAFIEDERVMIWVRDGRSQYLPKAIWFSGHVRDLIHRLFSGDFSYPLYDFSFGLGDEIIPKLDPFYWMYALFSPENMETGYQWVTITRMYMIGLAALIMFMYFKKEKWASVFASYIYVFCGFAFYAIPRHPQFATPMILFPLLIIACEEILRHGKWYLGTLLIGISLLSSYYFLYISTIGLIIYCLVRFIYMEKAERTIRRFFSLLFTFAWAYILGAGLGAMTIFTSFLNFTGSGRGGSATISTPSLWYYGQEWPTSLFAYFITAAKWSGKWLRTGFIPLAYLMIILLFIRKGRKVEKSLMLISLALCMIPAAGLLLNGFGNVSNRWTYMMALLVSFISAEMLPVIPRMTKREAGLISLAALPYALIALGYEEYDNEYVMRAIVLLLVSLIVVILGTRLIGLFSRRQLQLTLSALLIVSVWVGGYNLYSDYGGRNKSEEYTAVGEAINDMSDTNIVVFEGQNQNKTDFYRVSEPGISRFRLNTSMAYGIYGVAYYNSTMDGDIKEYNRLMGNCMFSLVEHVGFNNRTLLEALAAVRYYSIRADFGPELPYGYQYIDTEWKNGKEYLIYENQYDLPLGYTYNAWISRSELEQYELPERQEVMMTHAVIDDSESLQQQYSNLAPTTQAVKLDDVQLDTEMVEISDGLLKAEGQGVLDVSFQGLPNSETYLVIRGRILSSDEDDNTVYAYIGGEGRKYRITLYPENHTYNGGADTIIINLGYSETPLSRGSIRFDRETQMALDAVEVWCQPMDDYPQQIEALKQESLENLQISDNMMRGSITVSEPKILALSIPYSKNWHVYVDGEEADLLNVNIMYCGVELTPGAHEIEVRYESKAIRNGLIVTGISLLVFISCIIIRRNRSEKLKETRSE